MADTQTDRSESAEPKAGFSLKRLTPKQLAHLSELIAAEQKRRANAPRDTSGAGQMTDGEFQRWAREQTRNAEKAKQKEQM